MTVKYVQICYSNTVIWWAQPYIIALVLHLGASVVTCFLPLSSSCDCITHDKSVADRSTSDSRYRRLICERQVRLWLVSTISYSWQDQKVPVQVSGQWLEVNGPWLEINSCCTPCALPESFMYLKRRPGRDIHWLCSPLSLISFSTGFSWYGGVMGSCSTSEMVIEVVAMLNQRLCKLGGEPVRQPSVGRFKSN